MSVPISLSMTGEQQEELRRFLFPGDGNEAVALLLCARRAGNRRHRLLVRSIHRVPYEACSVRTPVRVTWPTEVIEQRLDEAEAELLSVMKIHSHPGGYRSFSPMDDAADRALLPMIRGSMEADIPHGSAVMLPSGEIFGRVLTHEGFAALHSVSVAGDELKFWYAANPHTGVLPDFTASHAQLFDEGTIERLQRLSVAVVGCSGTGSPVIEQLVRLGVGEIVLVDDDRVEQRNINRILNTTMDDARAERMKVEVLAKAIERMGLGTKVVAVAKNLWDPEVVRQVAQCDVLFGCMDTIDGRYLLNTLATFYTLPYFDIGVRLDGVAEEDGVRIREVCGTVNFLQPGKSSLISRGLFTLKQVADAGLQRNDPAAHSQQLEDGYIKGAVAHRPAVVSVNMFAASLAVNEFLARLHPYREYPNRDYASVTFSLSSMELIPDAEEAACGLLRPHVGRGDVSPLLRLLELSESRP